MAQANKNIHVSNTLTGGRHLRERINKKAALELSIGTIVIVVLGMTMLILGLVLVKNIFSISTKSVNTIDDKVTQEISQLFSDDNEDVVVMLGPDHTAKVKPSSGVFGLPIGARTLDGSQASRSRLQYKLSLDQGSNNNCASASKLGLKRTQSLFITALDKYNTFDKYQDSNVFALVQLNIPKATPLCTQKVFVDVKDTTTNQDVGGTFFIVEIIK